MCNRVLLQNIKNKYLSKDRKKGQTISKIYPDRKSEMSFSSISVEKHSYYTIGSQVNTCLRAKYMSQVNLVITTKYHNLNTNMT